MGRLIWFSQILCLSFMLFQFRVQSSSPSQSSPDSPPHVCHPEERSVLLDFKSTTALGVYLGAPHQKMETWKRSIDCCLWEGITYDKMEGHLIGLDLSWNWIEANLTANGSLSCLEKLQRLNLVYNKFSYLNLSFGFHRWESLTYLNLSASEYVDGPLLFEIFLLPKLVSLDFSNNYGLLLLDNIMFRMIVHNLTELRFLILDSVNMSLVVPSSLQNLTSSLEYLSLSAYSLQGNFPSQVFQLPSLRLIDLSHHHYLRGSLLESNWNSTLKYLYLKSTSFSRELSHSIRNFKLLEELDLFDCQIYGSIPRSLANITEITYLDFSSDLLQGQILDVMGKMHKLTHLSFSSNKFSGKIPASVSNLTHLTFLSLSSNKLLGRVPSWLFSLPSLSYLDLHDNRLTRPIDHIEMPNISLQEVYLSNNEISGSIPSFFFDLVNLSVTDLSSTNLSGTITPNMLSRLEDLNDLDLSNNSLLSLRNNGTVVNCSFLKLLSLRFSSCNIHKFPSFLRKAESLLMLDISKNKISGQIHKWRIEGMPLDYLNLSSNFLTGIYLLALGYLLIVKLRSNLLQGSLPILSTTWYFMYLIISGNNIAGEIPSSYCNLTSLRVLVLANNSLGGKIPECLGNLSDLSVLDLGMNKFHGRIPNSFVKNSSLRTLKLNGNQLEGRLPSSLVNCSQLEVLDVGNNSLNDSFPQWLGVLPSLQVLILRSNLFHGAISNSMPAFHFSQLKIIDVSHNDFTGPLPSKYFKNLTAMRDATGTAKLEYIGDTNTYYMDSVTVIMKGLEVTLVRIFKTFTTIDFSSNRFLGLIPEELGELNSLVLLNLSHNSLTGQIPSSWGKMRELESLDLSSNKLSGRIPEQLTDLTFLSVLNLSHNELVGVIPLGKQFNTFSNDSYIGNDGLCGFPLTKKCHPEEPRAPPSKFDEDDDSATLFNWRFALAGYGCGLVLGLSQGYIAFTTGKPWWVVKKVEKYERKFVGRSNGRHKKRKTQKPNQRF
ncbi:hypothetical protein SLE2022_353960 [Rubroshorea leprosula]